MKLTPRRSGCAVLSWIGALALLFLAPLAMAQNAPTWGGQIRAPIPEIESSIVINLRQQGVLTGHAPIEVDIFQYEVVLRDGAPNTNLVVSPYDPVPGNNSTVCIRIANAGYIPGSLLLSVQLQGTNALGTVTNLPGRTPYIVDPSGPTVNEGDPAQVQACEDGVEVPNQAPVVNAGPDRTVNDTDRLAGEEVPLTASATDPEGEPMTFAWYRHNGEAEVLIEDTQNPTASLSDGPNFLRFEATDFRGRATSDEVVITVNAPSQTAPSANAGADRVVDDTDAAVGEDVVLDGSTSLDPDGTIINYAWSRIDGESTEDLGNSASPTLQTRLPDGQNVIRLVVTDNSDISASDTVLITVGSATPVAPTANAGVDRTIADTDNDAGEDVVLDGSASSDPDGTLVNYAWSRIDGESTQSLGSGTSPTLRTRLADG
jgi:hypothetical protein